MEPAVGPEPLTPFGNGIPIDIEVTIVDDPNINPLYDALLGRDTNRGVFRMMGLIMTFIVIAGSCFYVLG